MPRLRIDSDLWRSVEECSRLVASWPEWKRAGFCTSIVGDNVSAPRYAKADSEFWEQVGSCPHCGAPIYGLFSQCGQPPERIEYTCECRTTLTPVVTTHRRTPDWLKPPWTVTATCTCGPCSPHAAPFEYEPDKPGVSCGTDGR